MTDTFTFLGRNRIYMGARARLIEEEREIAEDWAAQHIRVNPAYGWVLGRFVEAERANSNNQFFTLDGLQFGNPTIANAPMNVNHSARNIVGAFVASELIYPESADEHPFIESLGVFWRYYFPEEYQQVKAAQDKGHLFYSMECVPRAVSTVGGTDDSVEYAYEGRTSPNYPTELNDRSVPMNLIDPIYVGGALIIPPVNPGWKNADTQVIAGYMKDCWVEAEAAYEQISDSAPDLEARHWEALMAELILLEQSRDFSTDQRQRLAKEGKAMPDGGYPIATEQDLRNAIQAIGRAKNRAATIAHIKRRASALGLSKLIPENWN